MIVNLVLFIVTVAFALAIVLYALRKAFPKNHPVKITKIPADIHPWDGYGQRRHAAPETAEFSAVTPGQNKHYADETAEMYAIELPPVPRATGTEQWERDLQRRR